VCKVWLDVSTSCLLPDTLLVKDSVGEEPVTLTAVGLVETGLKHCPEPSVNGRISGLRLPLFHQNCPPEPLDLGCLRLGQVLELSTLGNSDGSVHPVDCSCDLTILRTVLCNGARVMGPGLWLSQTRNLTLRVPSSSPQTLTKRPTGRRTDSLTLLFLRPGSRLTNLERMSWTSGLIVDGPGGHGSMLGLLLRAGILLLRRFNHGLLALPLVTTHDTWSERRDEPADGTVMDGGKKVAARRRGRGGGAVRMRRRGGEDAVSGRMTARHGEGAATRGEGAASVRVTAARRRDGEGVAARRAAGVAAARL
jgi:hypothetical protein